MLAFAACVVLSATSCKDSFLEVDNPTGEPIENYYTTDAHIQEAVVAAYDPLHWCDWGLGSYNALNICSEIMSDNVWTGGANSGDMLNWQMLSNFSGNANNTLGSLWSIQYSGIKRCNDVLKYVGWGTDLTEKNKALYTAQARLLRVYYYNILWHYFGNIPFYLENLGMPYQADQMPADSVYTQLIAELEDVLSSKVLPMEWADNSATDKNIGRVSQAMGYMLYAEMVMYQKDTKKYPQALDYMKEIIDDTNYGLQANFSDIWLESGEWGKESIFEINYNDDGNLRGWASPLAVGGTVLPTLISPNSWPAEGGMGIAAATDGWGFMPLRTSTYEMFDEVDTRRAGTVFDARGVAYSKRYEDTGFWLNKYIVQSVNNADAGFDNNLNYNNNFRVYRFAETLLNAAELALNAGDTGFAQQCLDKVRTRAGLGSISVTQDNIIQERRLEFVGEGKRYWDLVRTDKAASILVVDGENGQTYRTKGWDAHNKYIPIAQGELDTSPNLVQNPGY